MDKIRYSGKAKSTTKDLVLIAMFAVTTAALAQIAIPMPFTQVPISLATFAVFLSGGLLGAKRATAAQLVYVLLGVIGLPVFANFNGGFGVIAGPTGGYIVGYIATALIVGIAKDKFPHKRWCFVLCMVLGTIVCYTLGTAWFMFVSHNNIWSSLLMCVIPFLPGDLLKIILAIFVTERLSKLVKFN